ncbi:hypothetical protein MLD38_008440 [Melastoma candidum]|uniref:Uncharacterized protein n=1 Tax=Melastoma candidum TaxID=119954 RepID=A0ACB9RW77_9MYRT|nr:hypothetical protein MLD38_008440 [Melastoma candidum]
MGGRGSKSRGRRHDSDRGQHGGFTSYPPPTPYHDPYPQNHPPHSYAPPPPPQYSSSFYESRAPPPPPPPLHQRKRLERKYSRIADNYRSLAEVSAALSQSGLESTNLIVGIDFTKSNEWTGARSFHHRSLHHIGNVLNPYEQAISIIGKTLSDFDDDQLIPCYGFGDASTHDQDVFNFYNDDMPCNGFEEVLERYREIVPHLRLAGPTSFAPIIEMAMTIVDNSGGQYHVLLIIADGQVTRSVETEPGHLSPQEERTIDAIVRASEFPLSIVLVGVGDGPWDMMREFDDNIPARAFDNFQFVNFTEIMSKKVDSSRKEAEFALAALMEIPSQYLATLDLNLLGRRRGGAPMRVPLPPPAYASRSIKTNGTSSFQSRETAYNRHESPAAVSASPTFGYPYDSQACPICFANPKNMAFGCGHQTCCQCGEDMSLCPICRNPIVTKIRLY